MTDLDQHPSTHSPRRKNFSFRFPNLSHSTSHDKDPSQLNGNGSHTLNHHQGLNYAGKDRRNFSEEAKNVPDLQVSELSPSRRCSFESTNTVHQEMLVSCSSSSWWLGRKFNSNSQTNLLPPRSELIFPNLTFSPDLIRTCLVRRLLWRLN